MSYYGRKRMRADGRVRVDIKRLCLYYVCLLILTLFFSTVEVSGIKIFGGVPSLCFCLVCASGFIFGERSGAIFGLVGGILLDSLGISGFSLNPILFTLCGYLCGKLVGWFLSINLPSFLIYCAIAGLVKEIFSLIHLGLVSTEFKILHILKNIILPDYFAFAICIVPIYFATLGIYLLFRGKDKKEFRF